MHGAEVPDTPDVDVPDPVYPHLSPPPTLPPPPVTPARWAPDPMGRHELRYWDGAAWTASVSDAGTQGIDPL